MEVEISKQLKTLIQALTHSGLNNLDEETFKRVKKICKSSQSSIGLVYELVKEQLKKDNSQIRLAAFQICKGLFSRSAAFRENVITDLHLIFELTTEINSSKKLPSPKPAADILKRLAISTLKSWVEDYGEAYKKLRVAYNYFEKCKNVKFESIELGNSTEQLLENERQRHLRLVNEEKIRKLLDEFNSNKSEIEMSVTSLSNCLCLLLPPADEFFVSDHISQKTEPNPQLTNHNPNPNCDDKKNDSDENEFEESDSYLMPNNSLREFGIPSNYSLFVHLDLTNPFKVIKTEENSAIIENAKDCATLITNRFLPMVKKWIKIYCKCSNSGGNDIKKMIDLKENLENVLKKFHSLGITEESHSLDDDSSSDDEFVEVKKEGYEETVNFVEDNLLHCLQKKPIAGPSSSTPEEAVCSTSACSFKESKESKESTSTPEASDRKSKLLAIAPKMPYDIDLYHWEDENLTAPTLLSTRIDVDKFWGSAGTDDLHEIPHPDGVAALRTRVIEFTGTFQPVKWACRAPLPSGKLCPRKDRFKCPFHGKIVPRDEMGVIQNKEEQKPVKETTGEYPSVVPDWQDPELLEDLKAITGVDLKIPEKRAKKRKCENKNLTHKKMKTTTAALKLMQAKQFPGLDDVVKKQNTAHARLKKKIFNRASLRRVTAVLDKLDRRKFKDKFGDQFNYT